MKNIEENQTVAAFNSRKRNSALPNEAVSMVPAKPEQGESEYHGQSPWESIADIQESQTLKRKAVSGVATLGVRRVVIQLIQTTANVILARILLPQEFGIFAIILFFLSIFTLISDFGLNAAIVQSDKEPSTEQLQTIFTIQLLLGLLATAIMWILASAILFFYRQQLGEKGLFFIQISSFALLLFNLKLVPSALLERAIRYEKLVIGEIIELIVLEVVTVWLALLGFGVVSFIWGILISRALAAVIFFLLNPWKIGLQFAVKDLKPLLSFGISYQLNQIIGVINGAVAPIVVGGVVGVTALGLVNWAGGVGALPRAVGDVMARIIFPMCARAQHDKKLLKLSIERAIQLTNMGSFPVIAIMIALTQPITFIIFTDKWKDGIPALYLFTFQSVFIVLGLVVTNALLALGYAKEVRNISLLWTALQWLLTIPLVKAFGFIGLAIAGIIVSATFFIPLRELKKHVPITISKHTLPYLIYASVCGICTYIYSMIFPIRSLLELTLAGTFGFLVYGFLLLLFKKDEIKEDFLRVYAILLNKK